MIKFILVNGEIKFLTHKVEWITPQEKKQERDFYDAEKFNAFIQHLEERKVGYTITEYEQPNGAILQRCAGLKFDTMDEARKAYENNFALPNVSTEQMRADIDFLAIMTGVDL